MSNLSTQLVSNITSKIAPTSLLLLQKYFSLDNKKFLSKTIEYVAHILNFLLVYFVSDIYNLSLCNQKITYIMIDEYQR